VKLSIQTLLKEAVDYAGLFPPAGLDMASSIRNYGAYASGGNAWALGRFIVPVSRLEEFNFHIGTCAAESGAKWGKVEDQEKPWRLSAISDGDLKTDLERVKRFNVWHGERDETQRVTIDTIEVKTRYGDAITATGNASPDSLRVFFEIPLDGQPEGLMTAIARAGGAAKVRTGGAAPRMVPTATTLVRFLDACFQAGVPFKATAGLRHPLHGVRSFKGEPGEQEGPTHGFLNLILCAAFMYDGMESKIAEDLLTEETVDAFRFGDSGIGWRDHEIGLETLVAARRDFALSFGSSSFEEPVKYLEAVGLL